MQYTIESHVSRRKCGDVTIWTHLATHDRSEYIAFPFKCIVCRKFRFFFFWNFFFSRIQFCRQDKFSKSIKCMQRMCVRAMLVHSRCAEPARVLNRHFCSSNDCHSLRSFEHLWTYFYRLPNESWTHMLHSCTRVSVFRWAMTNEWMNFFTKLFTVSFVPSFLRSLCSAVSICNNLSINAARSLVPKSKWKSFIFSIIYTQRRNSKMNENERENEKSSD